MIVRVNFLLVLLFFGALAWGQEQKKPAPTPLTEKEQVEILRLQVLFSQAQVEERQLNVQIFATPLGQQLLAARSLVETRGAALDVKLGELREKHQAAGKALDQNVEWCDPPCRPPAPPAAPAAPAAPEKEAKP